MEIKDVNLSYEGRNLTSHCISFNVALIYDIYNFESQIQFPPIYYQVSGHIILAVTVPPGSSE